MPLFIQGSRERFFAQLGRLAPGTGPADRLRHRKERSQAIGECQKHMSIKPRFLSDKLPEEKYSA